MSSSTLDPWASTLVVGGGLPTKSAKTSGLVPPVTFNTVFDYTAREWVRDCRLQQLDDCPLPGGLGHVVAGTGLRNLGRGVLSVRGVPPGAKPIRAILYWATIEPEDDPPAAFEVLFRQIPSSDQLPGGVARTGTMFGECLQPCWIEPDEPPDLPQADESGEGEGGEQDEQPDVSTWIGMNLRAYSVEVTDQLLASINGDYEISEVLSAVEDGSAPTSTADELFWGQISAEGAAMVVIYAHEELPWDNRTYVFEGPEFLFRYLDIDHTLTEPIVQGSTLFHSRIGAGGQVRYMGQPIHPYSTYLMDETGEKHQIRGWASPVNKRTDWPGARGDGAQRLWDAEQDYFYAPGHLNLQNSFRIRYAVDPDFAPDGMVPLDCVGVVAHVLTVQPPSY